MNDLTLNHSSIHPDISQKAQKLIKKLTQEQLSRLIHSWLFDHVNVAPPAIDEDEEDEDEDEEEDEDDSYTNKLSKHVSQLRNNFALIKAHPKSRLLHELSTIWSNGFTMFQVAQMETMYILESSSGSGFSWIYSTIFDNNNNLPFIPAIGPQEFLKELQVTLNPLVVGHTYVTVHSTLSLVAVRIQIFNPKSTTTTTTTTNNNTANCSKLHPVRPIYLALPSGSPHIIHSNCDPFYTNAISTTLSRVLSTPEKPVYITQSPEIPTNSLHTLTFLRSSTRQANSLGAWSIYAASQVDPSPLAHEPLKQKRYINNNASNHSDSIETVKKKKTINKKFTGDETKENKENIENKMSIFEVKLREPCGATETCVSLRFEGEDVFAGIHSLAVKGIVDADDVPLWLTGEEPSTSGIVKNGKFMPH